MTCRVGRYQAGPRNYASQFEPGSPRFATRDAAVAWAIKQSKTDERHHYVTDTKEMPHFEIGWATGGRFIWNPTIKGAYA